MVEESIGFGVTHMRAFVEVDLGVGMKCLEAGLALKEEFAGRCYIQICVFAQDPIMSYPDSGGAMKQMLEIAASKPGVEAIGSTPCKDTLMLISFFGLYLDLWSSSPDGNSRAWPTRFTSKYKEC